MALANPAGLEDLGPIPGGEAWQTLWDEVCTALDEDQKALSNDSPYGIGLWAVYCMANGYRGACLPGTEELMMPSFVREMHVQYDQEQGAENPPGFVKCDRPRIVSPSYQLLQELAIKGNVRTLAVLVEHADELRLDVFGQPRDIHENLLCAFAFEAARDSGNPICSGAKTGVSQGARMLTPNGQLPQVGDELVMVSRDFDTLRPAKHPWTKRWAKFSEEGRAGRNEELNGYVTASIRFMRALHMRYADFVEKQPVGDDSEKLRQAATQLCVAFESEDKRQQFAESMVCDGTLWTVLTNPCRLEAAAGNVGALMESPQAKSAVVRSLALEVRSLIGAKAGGHQLFSGDAETGVGSRAVFQGQPGRLG